MSEISEALRGPWVAALYDNYGHLFGIDELDELDEDDDIVEIAVVRRSATPTRDRMPGSYTLVDVLYTVDDFEDNDEVRMRWEQAQAVAQALNTLAGSASGATR